MIEKPHKKLDVWKRSIDLVEQVYQLTQPFSKTEEFGLTSQMRRASVSVPANIAEGAARQTKREFLHFLHISQGSLSEVDTYLEICRRLKYIGPDTCDEVSILVDKVDKMLTGLIKAVRKETVQ